MTKTFSIRDSIREGFTLTKQNFGAIILVFVLLMGIGGFKEFISYALEHGNSALAYISFSMLSIVVDFWLYSGLVLLTLKATHTGRIVMSDLFAGLPYTLGYMGASILIGLVSLLVFLPGLILMFLLFALMGPSMDELREFASGDPLAFVQAHGMFLIAELVVFGLIIIPVMVVSLYLGFSIYLLIDKKISVLDALPFSVQVARGAIWPLINFSVAMVLLNMAGALCLLVGLLVSIPTTAFAYICVYRDLLQQTEAQLGHPLGKVGILSKATEALTE